MDPFWHDLSVDIVIKTDGLYRDFKTYRRADGGWNALKGFFNRTYETRHALLPTTLSVPSGQVIGLVGANGAGKTTLLKILSGLIYPSGGSVEVLGFKPWERKSEFLRQISILLGQKAQLWFDLPAADSFSLLAEIYGLDLKMARSRWQTLAERLGCQDQLHIQLRRLSLGERMKMEIIGSLLHQPRILFLDEPTIGLDVLAQNTIRTFLFEYVRDHQPTIILTSHYMDDISSLADRLLLIGQGRMVYDGTVAGFTGFAKQNLQVDLGREDVDFEEVIHRFLQKELGSAQASRTVTT